MGINNEFVNLVEKTLREDEDYTDYEAESTEAVNEILAILNNPDDTTETISIDKAEGINPPTEDNGEMKKKYEVINQRASELTTDPSVKGIRDFIASSGIEDDNGYGWNFSLGKPGEGWKVKYGDVEIFTPNFIIDDAKVSEDIKNLRKVIRLIVLKADYLHNAPTVWNQLSLGKDANPYPNK